MLDPLAVPWRPGPHSVPRPACHAAHTPQEGRAWHSPAAESRAAGRGPRAAGGVCVWRTSRDRDSPPCRNDHVPGDMPMCLRDVIIHLRDVIIHLRDVIIHLRDVTMSPETQCMCLGQGRGRNRLRAAPHRGPRAAAATIRAGKAPRGTRSPSPCLAGKLASRPLHLTVCVCAFACACACACICVRARVGGLGRAWPSMSR